MSFSKIFESDRYGQILVKKDTNGEDKAEVRFYVQPEDLGICSIALAFSSDEAAQDVFEFTEIDLAEKIVGEINNKVFAVFNKIPTGEESKKYADHR